MKKMIFRYRWLIGLAGLLILLGIGLIHCFNQSTWQYEIGKTLFSLAIIVIIGTLIKQLIDEAKKNIEKEELAKQKKLEKEEKINKILYEKVNKLSEIKGKIIAARLYISTHKSALSYGKAIREQFIPIETELNQIEFELTTIKALTNLKVKEHFESLYSIIDKLKMDYEKEYLSLSHKQSYIERKKKNLVEKFIKAHDSKSEENTAEENEVKRDELTDSELDEQLKKIKLPTLQLENSKINEFIKKDSKSYENAITSITELIKILKQKELSITHGDDALT